MERYFVDVKQVGHWWERYEVEAESEEDAKKIGQKVNSYKPMSIVYLKQQLKR